MQERKEFYFNGIYEMVDIIQVRAKYNEQFFNHNLEYFIERASKFNKETLLHQYIVVSLMNHFHRYCRRNGDCWADDDDEIGIELWDERFEHFKINIQQFSFEIYDRVIDWFDENEDKFIKLFERMADGIFYTLFNNRGFLLDFNKTVALFVEDSISQFPSDFVTHKGRIKRRNIPKWLKKAVFYRDKGKCVLCGTDLTNTINTLQNENYDHIVPLDLYGVNDPCNIQLLCEKCNKKKSNKKITTSEKYYGWW